MELLGKVAVITRGTSEIGMVLAKRFLQHGATVVISGIDIKVLTEKAKEIGAVAMAANVAIPSEIKYLIEKVAKRFGKIDLFASLASFADLGSCSLPEKDWNQRWHTDVMSQMYAAKYALPHMTRRQNGYLLNMVPTMGLHEEFCSESYTTLKHPSLSFAERVADAYGQFGIKISLLCAVDQSGAINPRCLARLVLKGIQEEQFMIDLHKQAGTVKH